MAGKRGKSSGVRNNDRQNGKGFKKYPKKFYSEKRLLVTVIK